MTRRTRDTACLILHGFGGGPHEVAPLAAYLEALGHEVRVPLLAGHGTTRAAMRRAKAEDWIATAEKELLLLRGRGKEVVLIGFSMGGLLAFHLASRHEVSAIVTINTPIHYWNLRQVLRNLDEDWQRRRLTNTRRYLEAKRSSPIPAMIEFLRLLGQAKRKLSTVRCPLLVVQAEDDDTVRRRSVEFIRRHAASEEVKTHFLKEGGHVILLSPKAPVVISLVAGFLEDVHQRGSRSVTDP